MRSLLVLSVITLLGLLAAPGTAGAAAPTACDPRSYVCLGQPCNTSAADMVGVTTMDGDQKNLIACLKNDAGEYRWKSMSGGSEGPQGSYCGFLTCRVWPCYGGPVWPELVQTTCDLSGVLEHIPCNGHSLVTTGTCTGSTQSVTAQEMAVGAYFPIMSCPPGYSKKRMNFMPTLEENPYGTGGIFFTCVKN